MKILIVDDNSDIVDVVRFSVPMVDAADVAFDGDKAVAAVEKSLDENQPYDLILMDIMMPNMDGRSAVRKIRRIEEARGIMLGDGAKIVMITALGDSENVFGSFHRDGCDGYIVKPFDQKNITEVLTRIGLI
ncbi:MAG: response regulator [Planctomycetes bacterium]|nr:response regulator [Planctomycetota bacterium]